MIITRVFFAAVAFLILTGPVHAATVNATYSGVTATTTEDFQSYASGTTFSSQSFNGFTATYSGVRVFNETSLGVTACSSSPNQCLIQASGSVSDPRLFDGFGFGTTAFGFNLFDNNGQTYNLTVSGLSGTTVFSILGSGMYAFADTLGLTSISITNLGWLDTSGGLRYQNYSIDDVITGTISKISPVPVPASLPLMFVGLAGFGWVFKRRKATPRIPEWPM